MCATYTSQLLPRIVSFSGCSYENTTTELLLILFQECLDWTFSWFHGLASFPLLPSTQEEEDEEDEGLDESMKETAREKEEKKSDYDVATQDVVKVNEQEFMVRFTSQLLHLMWKDILRGNCWSAFQGLLKMKLLPRLRYILEVVRPSPRVVQDILQILTRISRHSLPSATEVTGMMGKKKDKFCLLDCWTCQFTVFTSQVLNCPRLMETVLSEFLPESWSSPKPQSVYKLPLANAMKLLRVLATSGRHICARLVTMNHFYRAQCLLKQL